MTMTDSWVLLSLTNTIGHESVIRNPLISLKTREQWRLQILGRAVQTSFKPNHFVIEGAGTRSRHSRIHIALNFAAGIKTKQSFPSNNLRPLIAGLME